jgi:AcrR family transcriptional regulator
VLTCTFRSNRASGGLIASGSGIARRRAAARKEGHPLYVAKRAEILRASAKLFREKGYIGTSLSDIAERVNIDRATIYYYVAGKEEILGESVTRVVEANLAMGQRILADGGSASAMIRDFMTGLLRSYQESYPTISIYTQEEMSGLARQRSGWTSTLARQRRQSEDIVTSMIAEGVRAGEFRVDVDPDLMAYSFWSMVNWTSRWLKPGARHDAEAAATGLSTIFLDGIARRTG